MIWRTLIFKLLLNRCLSSHRCEAQQFLTDELLNFDLERVTILYRIPYVSDMISACGIGIILIMVGKLSRLDLFGHNFPIINQYRQQMCIRHRNWIIAMTSPFLIVVSFINLFLLQLLISLSGPLMWQEILFQTRKWQNSCKHILYVTLLQIIPNTFINYNPIWGVHCHVVHKYPQDHVSCVLIMTETPLAPSALMLTLFHDSLMIGGGE